MIRHFRRVAMLEKIVCAEIFVHLHEVRFSLGFFARAGHARFAIAHDPAAMSIQPDSTSGFSPKITEVG